MTYRLEVSEDGTLTLPAETIHHAAPHTPFVVEADCNRMTVQPVKAVTPEVTNGTEEKWIYVAAAQEFSVSLVTWDQEVVTRTANVITAMTPAQWLTIYPAPELEQT